MFRPFKYIASVLFGILLYLRQWFYWIGLFKIHIFNTPIVSIGNLEFGGTGKTPMVAFISKILTEKKIKHAIISRGYKKETKGLIEVSNGSEILVSFVSSCGDEPLLLAHKLKGVPVVVSPNKAKAIQYVIDRFSPEIVLMDDGLQSLGIYRDLDIVLLNSSTDLSDFNLFPLGSLRDFKSSLKKADWVVLTKLRKQNSGETLKLIDNYNLPSALQQKVLTSKYKTSLLEYSWDSGGFSQILVDQNLRELACVAFCGIGDPASFFKDVSAFFNTVEAFVAFENHFNYSQIEGKWVNKIFLFSEKALLSNCSPSVSETVYVTTYKDFFKFKTSLDDLFRYRNQVAGFPRIFVEANKVSAPALEAGLAFSTPRDDLYLFNHEKLFSNIFEFKPRFLVLDIDHEMINQEEQIVGLQKDLTEVLKNKN